MQTKGVDDAKLVHSAFLPEAMPCMAEVSAPLAADFHLKQYDAPAVDTKGTERISKSGRKENSD